MPARPIQNKVRNPVILALIELQKQAAKKAKQGEPAPAKAAAKKAPAKKAAAKKGKR